MTGMSPGAARLPGSHSSILSEYTRHPGVSAASSTAMPKATKHRVSAANSKATYKAETPRCRSPSSNAVSYSSCKCEVHAGLGGEARRA